MFQDEHLHSQACAVSLAQLANIIFFPIYGVADRWVGDPLFPHPPHSPSINVFAYFFM